MSALSAFGGALFRGPRRSLEQCGDQLIFYLRCLAWTPRAITRYRREIVNTLAQ